MTFGRLGDFRRLRSACPTPTTAAPRRRRLLWLGVGLLVLLAGFGLWRILRRPAPLLFTTASVDIGPVVARVTATGILSALVTVPVGSQVSGTRAATVSLRARRR